MEASTPPSHGAAANGMRLVAPRTCCTRPTCGGTKSLPSKTPYKTPPQPRWPASLHMSSTSNTGCSMKQGLLVTLRICATGTCRGAPSSNGSKHKPAYAKTSVLDQPTQSWLMDMPASASAAAVAKANQASDCFSAQRSGLPLQGV